MARSLPPCSVPGGQWRPAIWGHVLYVNGRRFGDVRPDTWPDGGYQAVRRGVPCTWSAFVFGAGPDTTRQLDDEPHTRRSAMTRVEAFWHYQERVLRTAVVA